MKSNSTGSGSRTQTLLRLRLTSAFLAIQTCIVLLFVLLIIDIRDPQVRIDCPMGENQNFSGTSFSIDLKARVTVRNMNFGRYEFGNSTITVSYLGTVIGEAAIPKEKVDARSVGWMEITVSLSSSSMANDHGRLRSDLSDGVLRLSSTAKLEGEIYIFMVFKKKKSAEMNCTMELDTETSAIENLSCCNKLY